jgi:hypothetical protein
MSVPRQAAGEFWEELNAYTVATYAMAALRPGAVGSYPIVTLQYSSTTLYQVSDHIQSLFF